ncbi:pilus assembly PilX N-terminal domain-containing protein [Ottowia sp.]|jgi:hypothetical protein|uniref:pilus assembly PilX N-terminal domain-containing protein n=1 Tax=Ottowia sp. TaxID=1898956 RepID=UPI002C336B11|nr:pilus assembly PilX N-terminal domain-containing protein [Ottowia sp.]HRN74785.1 pilus assembly PilX N-terminal domain-containing protein [Ottowia sp.]HRQ01937.1 pilus assembly PilX N-terminal domain-containing protein [Ottowia sp.]
MMNTHRIPINAAPCRQRGVGSLAITTLLLLAASIVVLYLNRSVIFEQRTSANQMRAASAHEMAEAGLEWAIGMLNHGSKINTTCGDDVTASDSFRARYVKFPTDPISGLPVTATEADKPKYRTALPGCSIDPGNGSLNCSCPPTNDPDTPPNDPAHSGSAPHFTVHFEPEKDNADTQDPNKFHWETVRITAVGCTAAVDVCTPPTPDTPANSGNADAMAIASVAVKLRPGMVGGPFAPLTCGGSCKPGGSYNIVNTSVASNGMLVNAGTSIGEKPLGEPVDIKNSVTLITIPGVPIENALVPGDSSLAELSASDPDCSKSAVFQSFFGSTIEQYRDSPTTTVISCSNSTDCGKKTKEAYAEGARALYYPDGVWFNNSSGFPIGPDGNPTLGTESDPVIIVTPKIFDINGNITINAMIFSNSSNLNDLGTGNADINGAIATCKDQKSNGNGTIKYSDGILANARRASGSMVKVPGSWRDWSQL